MSPPRATPLLITALVLLAAACVPDPNAPGSLALRNLDFNYFACNVQPLTAARCAMTACHGAADHAFRVYSPGKLRLAAARTQTDRDAAIRRAEVDANLASMRGLAPAGDNVDDLPLLRKALAPDAGGGEHKGGVVFASTSDPDYQRLRAWLTGATQPAGCALTTALQMNP